MKASEIVISAMKVRGYNQTILAKEAGLKRQTNVSEMLRSKSMRVDNFLLLLNSMDFDIVVVDRNKTNNNPIKWVVGSNKNKPAKLDLDKLLSDQEPVKTKARSVQDGRPRIKLT